MYHRVLPTTDEELTVSTENLELQFQYLLNKGYKSKFISELDDKNPEKKTILITFDDGYKNNQQYLLPLLKKYNLKATIFIPTKLIENDCDKMNFEELKNIDKNFIELALHSHAHTHYNKMSLAEIEKDIEKNIYLLQKNNVPFTRALAYPYGKYPRNKDFFELIKKMDIKYAFRIGNRINYFPFIKPYEINRIGVEGWDDVKKFSLRLTFGKLKL